MNPFNACIYHANCNDGLTAAAVCYHWHARHNYPQPEYLAANYKDAAPVMNNERVLIADFSYPPQVMFDLAENNDVVWIDHHVSAITAMTMAAFDRVNEGVDVPALKRITDMQRSGAGLTWNYFNPGIEPPLLVELVEDRDLWTFKHRHTKTLNAGLEVMKPYVDHWADLVDDTAQVERLIEVGQQLLIAKRNNVTAMLEHVHELTLVEDKVPACNVPPMWASDTGHALLNLYPEAPYCVTYFVKGERAQFSLRSRDDREDVSQIAKAFGGGGHRNAAGFVARLSEFKRGTYVASSEEAQE